MNIPQTVKIVEVGPRDGLQNERLVLNTAQRVEFINKLSSSGLSVVEVGSFVREDRVPQMANTAEVFRQLEKKSEVSFPALVPNIKGFTAALAAGIQEIAIFASASETFSQKNINCSVAESLRRFEEFLPLAIEKGVKIRGYVSCVAGCPYQGEVALSETVAVCEQLINQGCYEVSLGDTIGVATPAKISALINALQGSVSIKQLALHCHDTYGQALANIYAGLQMGVAVVDSSVAGLGGCPYAKGASGNVATEDVLYLMQGLGIETNVDLETIANAGTYICNQLGRDTQSKVAKALYA